MCSREFLKNGNLNRCMEEIADGEPDVLYVTDGDVTKKVVLPVKDRANVNDLPGYIEEHGEVI